MLKRCQGWLGGCWASWWVGARVPRWGTWAGGRESVCAEPRWSAGSWAALGMSRAGDPQANAVGCADPGRPGGGISNSAMGRHLRGCELTVPTGRQGSQPGLCPGHRESLPPWEPHLHPSSPEKGCEAPGDAHAGEGGAGTRGVWFRVCFPHPVAVGRVGRPAGLGGCSSPSALSHGAWPGSRPSLGASPPLPYTAQALSNRGHPSPSLGGV